MSCLLTITYKYITIYGPMKADKQLTQNDDAGHKCDIVINNIH